MNGDKKNLNVSTKNPRISNQNFKKSNEIRKNLDQSTSVDELQAITMVTLGQGWVGCPPMMVETPWKVSGFQTTGLVLVGR